MMMDCSKYDSLLLTEKKAAANRPRSIGSNSETALSGIAYDEQLALFDARAKEALDTEEKGKKEALKAGPALDRRLWA